MSRLVAHIASHLRFTRPFSPTSIKARTFNVGNDAHTTEKATTLSAPDPDQRAGAPHLFQRDKS
ncbi:hypothetical protein E4U40_000286 [Claviceps sp. LM458 group G5]|nr:hypothetical protein E4U40_000286 [Claviceps sp. LM458 group G5]